MELKTMLFLIVSQMESNWFSGQVVLGTGICILWMHNRERRVESGPLLKAPGLTPCPAGLLMGNGLHSRLTEMILSKGDISTSTWFILMEQVCTRCLA